LIDPFATFQTCSDTSTNHAGRGMVAVINRLVIGNWLQYTGHNIRD